MPRMVMPLPGIMFWGLQRKTGGHCDKCDEDRLVIWVQELQGFRCSTCLYPREFRVREWNEVVPDEAPMTLDALREMAERLDATLPGPVEGK